MARPADCSLRPRARKLVLNKTMVLETNYVCNLRCVHCYVPSPRKRTATFLNVELVEDLLGQFQRLGFEYVLLTGGEPLVHPRFDDIYQSAWDRGFHVSLFSNGLLLDDRRLDLLTRKPPALVRISMFGGSPATYARVAGRDGFDLVRSRILELHERKVPVRVKIPLLRYNASDAAAIREDLARRGISCKIDMRIIPRFDGDRESLDSRLTPEEILDLGLEDPRANLEHYRRLRHQPPGSIRTLQYCLERCQPFIINPEGRLQLCFLIRDWMVDLRRCSLSEAITTLAQSILEASSDRAADECNACSYRTFCSYCPGWARNEVGRAGEPIPFLCRLAELFEDKYRQLDQQTERTHPLAERDVSHAGH